jgi:hypothetical protein
LYKIFLHIYYFQSDIFADISELSINGVTAPVVFCVLQSITAKLVFSFNDHLPVKLLSMNQISRAEKFKTGCAAKYGKVTRQS